LVEAVVAKADVVDESGSRPPDNDAQALLRRLLDNGPYLSPGNRGATEVRRREPSAERTATAVTIA
jgi:hypothetical protein